MAVCVDNCGAPMLYLRGAQLVLDNTSYLGAVYVIAPPLS